MKKRLLLIAILLLVCVGCAFSPEGVILYNKYQANRIVNKEYGKAKYIDTSKIGDSVTYTFEDKELKFQYKYKCYPESISIDGTTFGYSQTCSTTFYEEYFNYVKENIESDVDTISRKYDVRIYMDKEWDKYGALATIESNENDNAKAYDAGIELKELFKEYDTRKDFEHALIRVEYPERRYDNIAIWD